MEDKLNDFEPVENKTPFLTNLKRWTSVLLFIVAGRKLGAAYDFFYPQSHNNTHYYLEIALAICLIIIGIIYITDTPLVKNTKITTT